MEGHGKMKIDRKKHMTRATRDPIYRSKGQTFAGGGKFWHHIACVFYRAVNVQQTISVL